MSRTPQGITVQWRNLPQQPTLSNMTQSELNFALLVEEMLNHIQKPEYRQTVVEVSVFYKSFVGFILRQHIRILR
jgi:phosphorylase kinase alpha/beta subunit